LELVIVEIGRPMKFRGLPVYCCLFRIWGIRDDYISAAGGVDAVQAPISPASDLCFPLKVTDEKGVVPAWATSVSSGVSRGLNALKRTECAGSSPAHCR
jgi:hypothetical protein